MSNDIVSKNGDVVGQWNGEDVADLQKTLRALGRPSEKIKIK